MLPHNSLPLLPPTPILKKSIDVQTDVEPQLYKDVQSPVVAANLVEVPVPNLVEVPVQNLVEVPVPVVVLKPVMPAPEVIKAQIEQPLTTIVEASVETNNATNGEKI